MMNRQNLLVSFKRHNVTFHGQFSIIFFHPVSVSLWRVDADAHVAGFLLYLLTIYTDNAVYVEINTLDSYSFIRSRGRVHCSDIRRAKQNRQAFVSLYLLMFISCLFLLTQQQGILGQLLLLTFGKAVRWEPLALLCRQRKSSRSWDLPKRKGGITEKNKPLKNLRLHRMLCWFMRSRGTAALSGENTRASRISGQQEFTPNRVTQYENNCCENKENSQCSLFRFSSTII